MLDQDVMALEKHGMVHVDEKRAQTQQFYIPWKHDGRVIGITYVELSNAALSRDFWKKESALLFQVIAWSTSGILALSAVAIFAYRAWQRAGRVQERAELAQQGLLAERGLTAAVLAHEIRNPLQALRFQLHSLRKNAQDPARVGRFPFIVLGGRARNTGVNPRHIPPSGWYIDPVPASPTATEGEVRCAVPMCAASSRSCC